jgi:transposase
MLLMMTDKQRPVVAPTEVRPKAKRRTFSAQLKRRVLAEVDACTKPGEVGALLRREGL